MNVRVNGVSSPAPDSPDTTAAEHIRDRLGLTGTKIACGTGVCGACTVLVEGAPTASCLLPADRLEDREVTTVEGLGGDHPVQRAFAAHDGMQCGYCTPGFVVEASAFVDSWRAEHGDVRPGRDHRADHAPEPPGRGGESVDGLVQCLQQGLDGQAGLAHGRTPG
ncbi:(2Fe-2S)-binding protein, partial [Nocardiopsis dassonvillei]|uniref:(2Fe-2S)-binding protein n=1 Tax=Nocardiopsis dassonvillei TaxID=2014 RepID=UPI001FF7EF6E